MCRGKIAAYKSVASMNISITAATAHAFSGSNRLKLEVRGFTERVHQHSVAIASYLASRQLKICINSTLTALLGRQHLGLAAGFFYMQV